MRAIDDQTGVEGLADIRFAGGIDLDAGHEAAAAHFFYDGAGEFAELGVEIESIVANSREEAIDFFQEGEGDTTREGTTAKGGAMHALGDGRARIGGKNGGSKRETGGERFGGDDDIGASGAGMLLPGEAGAGATQAALRFVGDPERIMAGGGSANRMEKIGRERKDAALALDRFGDDGDEVVAGGVAQRVHVVGGEKNDIGDEGMKRLPVLRFGRDGERAGGAAVESVVERDDPVAGASGAVRAGAGGL